MTIRKSDLISMLIASLDEKMLDMDLEAEENEFDQSLSSMAHLLLRKLQDTKWIEVEYPIDSFEENISLPDYTVDLLNVLYSFTDETVREYNSYVYSTYSSLKTADSERDDFMYSALLTAYENTVKLVDELKTLYNSIRRSHQTLNDYVTANDVLIGHFDEYKKLITDRIYHPLKTLDSVPRFKTPITTILSSWLINPEIREKIAGQAIQRGKYHSMVDAMDDLLLKMGEIGDIYEGIDGMLEEIDRKNAAYTKASIEKMQYLLNADRSIKGKLVDILTARPADPDAWAEKIAEGINLYRQKYVDEKSLYNRSGSIQRKEETRLELAIPETDAGEEAMNQFAERARKLYSHRRVVAFIDKIMEGKNIMASREIRLCNDEEFILLILASLKAGEKGLPYQVEFEEGYHSCDGYNVPQMRFVRKGGN
ncbi:DUF5716 family protein [Bacillota bacterium]